MHGRQFIVRRAFTLPETLVAAAVLAFAVAAICQAVVSGQMHTYAAVNNGRSVTLAEALMDEVISLPYNDPQEASVPGPEQGEQQRSQFDNIDDYDGYIEDVGELADEDAHAYADPLQTYTRQVAVVPYTMSVGTFGQIEGLLVTITVQDKGSNSYTLKRFVASPGADAEIVATASGAIAGPPPDEGGEGESGGDTDGEAADDDDHGPGNNGQGHAYGHDKSNRGRGRW